MKAFLICMVVLAVAGYIGVAFLMENMTFESLPGQVGRGTSYAIWDGAARDLTGELSMAEVQDAIEFNPKIRLLSYRGRVQRISPADAERKREPGDHVYRVPWPQPLQKGEQLGYFKADVTFTVESTCVPCRIKQKSFKFSVITSCPI